MQANFVKFVTGSYKIKAEGWKESPITLYGCNNKNQLPVAHACFNQLDLPNYNSKKELKHKLTLSITITGGEGFYIA